MVEIAPRKIDTRCWAYRLAEDGSFESDIFPSRAHVPVGLGWTDSPAKVHDAAKEAAAAKETHKATKQAASDANKAKAELNDAMGDYSKDELFSMAESMGVKIDRRWSIERLKAEIATHQPQLEPNRLPPFVEAAPASVPEDEAL